LEENWLEQEDREQRRPAVWKTEEIAATGERSAPPAATSKPARSQPRATTAGSSSRGGLMEWVLALLFILLFLVVVYVALSMV
jgi:hypothetical protein